MVDDRRDEVSPIDLTALDPTADAVRFERVVASLCERASPVLARRAASRASGVPGGRTMTWSLRDWQRIAWPAAAAIALASLAVLRVGSPAIGATLDPDQELAAAVGVPAALAEWLGEDAVGTEWTRLLVTLEEER